MKDMTLHGKAIFVAKLGYPEYDSYVPVTLRKDTDMDEAADFLKDKYHADHVEFELLSGWVVSNLEEL